MSRTIAIPFAMLVGWSLYCVVWAQEPSADKAALPPSAADTQREAKIEAALRQPVSLSMVELPLIDVIEYLTQKSGLRVRLDARALADAAIDPVSKVTFETTDQPLESALISMFDDLELRHVVQDGTLKVTSKEKADGVVTTRVYPVADLVFGGAPSSSRPRTRGGPLIQLILDAIAPDSWDLNSGIGSIKLFRCPSGWTLVVTNTRRVHAELAILLADLRAAKQKEGTVEDAQDAKTLRREVYDIGGVSGAELVHAITATIEPESWDLKKGLGQIWAIPITVTRDVTTLATKEKPAETTQVVEKSWRLVVTQTEEVLQEIDDFLSAIKTSKPVSFSGTAMMNVRTSGSGSRNSTDTSSAASTSENAR